METASSVLGPWQMQRCILHLFSPCILHRRWQRWNAGRKCHWPRPAPKHPLPVIIDGPLFDLQQKMCSNCAFRVRTVKRKALVFFLKRNIIIKNPVFRKRPSEGNLLEGEKNRSECEKNYRVRQPFGVREKALRTQF